MRVWRSRPRRAEDITIQGSSAVRVQIFAGFGVQDSVFELGGEPRRDVGLEHVQGSFVGFRSMTHPNNPILISEPLLMWLLSYMGITCVTRFLNQIWRPSLTLTLVSSQDPQPSASSYIWTVYNTACSPHESGRKCGVTTQSRKLFALHAN